MGGGTSLPQIVIGASGRTVIQHLPDLGEQFGRMKGLGENLKSLKGRSIFARNIVEDAAYDQDGNTWAYSAQIRSGVVTRQVFGVRANYQQIRRKLTQQLLSTIHAARV